MSTATRIARPDFCFSAAVLSGVDATDICEAFGLSSVDDGDDVAQINGVFCSLVNETATVVGKR